MLIVFYYYLKNLITYSYLWYTNIQIYVTVYKYIYIYIYIHTFVYICIFVSTCIYACVNNTSISSTACCLYLKESWYFKRNLLHFFCVQCYCLLFYFIFIHSLKKCKGFWWKKSLPFNSSVSNVKDRTKNIFCTVSNLVTP